MSARYFIAICLLMGFGKAFGQNFTAEVSDTTLYGIPVQNTFFGDIDLTNSTSAPLNLVWVKTNEVLPAGWETSNCDPDLCHPIGTDSAQFTLSTNGYINCHFYPNGIAGSGEMTIKVYELSNPSASIELTFYGVANPNGIGENELAAVSAYPNPFKEELSVTAMNGPISVELYDMTGRLVFESANEIEDLSVNTKSYNSGFYFLKVGDHVKKLVKR